MKKESYTETQAHLSELIKKKSQHEQQKNILQKQEEETQRVTLQKEVEALSPRVEVLISLAVQCQKEGINFPPIHETNSFGYGNGAVSFIADDFYHRVGFIRPFTGEISAIGILNGGALGPYDLYVDKDSVLMRRNDCALETKAPDTNSLKQFLRDFPNFEQAFYDWIESFAEDIHECEDTQPPLPTI